MNGLIFRLERPKIVFTQSGPEADFHGAGRQADAIKPNAEHDGEFLSSLLVLSSIATRATIGGNQEESFGNPG